VLSGLRGVSLYQLTQKNFNTLISSTGILLHKQFRVISALHIHFGLSQPSYFLLFIRSVVCRAPSPFLPSFITSFFSISYTVDMPHPISIFKEITLECLCILNVSRSTINQYICFRFASEHLNFTDPLNPHYHSIVHSNSHIMIYDAIIRNL
jgi:hypothetical protein